MSAPVHFAAPTALDFFSALVADDSSLSVLETAIAVAQDELPELDVQGVLAEVDTLADRLRRRVPVDAAPLQRLRLLNQYFFQELGFAGNVNNYQDPRNSFLHAVLETRRGIPLTLAMVYIEVATQIGLRACGVSFPGHFLVKLQMPRGEVVIDPFSGRSLTREDLEERLLPYRRQRGALPDDEVPLGLYLQPAQPREMIARLLRNLKEIHRMGQDTQRLAAVLQRLVILLPDEAHERRELALVLAQLGRHEQAAQELATYLLNSPDSRDGEALGDELARWRRAH